MISDCVLAKPNSYYVDPFAIDTVGNIIFATAWLRKLGLDRPVFVTSEVHLARQVVDICHSWFMKSTVRPLFWGTPDEDPSSASRSLRAQLESYFRDRRQGVGHIFRFSREVRPYYGDLLSIDRAIEWLFEADQRYKDAYGDPEALKRRLPR